MKLTHTAQGAVRQAACVPACVKSFTAAIPLTTHSSDLQRSVRPSSECLLTAVASSLKTLVSRLLPSSLNNCCTLLADGSNLKFTLGFSGIGIIAGFSTRQVQSCRPVRCTARTDPTPATFSVGAADLLRPGNRAERLRSIISGRRLKLGFTSKPRVQVAGLSSRIARRASLHRGQANSFRHSPWRKSLSTLKVSRHPQAARQILRKTSQAAMTTVSTSISFRQSQRVRG